MITYPCKYVGDDGKPCTGHVKYKVSPVEMVSFLEQFKIPDLPVKDLPLLEMKEKFNTAWGAHVRREAKKEATEDLPEKSTKRLKTIYLTCDAEAMHVEPYDIHSKK